MVKSTLDDAIILATQLHRGQLDKAGACYILHPLRVMMDPSLNTEEERIVAVLHDTVEDSGITLKQLRDLGYSDNVVEALSFVTKFPEEKNNYEAFIDRICSGPLLARKVKLADLKDNLILSRIPQPTERDFKRWEKYIRAVVKLAAAN